MYEDLVRIGTGIPGLDDMVEGGYPFPSTMLVAGGTGTGKTTFATQFLFEGARNGEQCLFFTTLSESVHWMLRFAVRHTFMDKKYFGHEIKYVDLGSRIKSLRLKNSGELSEVLLDMIESEVVEAPPQRVVLDPVTIFESMMDEQTYRTFLYDLSSGMKNWQSTTLITGEVMPDSIYSDIVLYIA